MSFLPKKTTPQEWEDVTLPGFDQPAKREESKKEQDDAEHKIYYRRYRGAKSIACHACVAEGSGVRNATHVRTFQGQERYLCSPHTQAARDRRDRKGKHL
jgi:hypothetical protein